MKMKVRVRVKREGEGWGVGVRMRVHFQKSAAPLPVLWIILTYLLTCVLAYLLTYLRSTYLLQKSAAPLPVLWIILSVAADGAPRPWHASVRRLASCLERSMSYRSSMAMQKAYMHSERGT